jgi:hypothetical protein
MFYSFRRNLKVNPIMTPEKGLFNLSSIMQETIGIMEDDYCRDVFTNCIKVLTAISTRWHDARIDTYRSQDMDNTCPGKQNKNKS